MRLKDLPKEERPRERLKKYGVESLSNAELLQILLKSGTKEKDVKCLSEEVLVHLEKSENISLSDLLEIKGLGEVKAYSILAFLELGKRIYLSPNKEKPQITTAKSAWQYTRSFFYQQKQECFYCLYLNHQKQVIGEKLLFKGTVSRSAVHPREVFKEAYKLGASAIICMHNHPSNFLTPSKEDVLFTKKLKEIGEIQMLPILDHIIVGDSDYYSFLERCEF